MAKTKSGIRVALQLDTRIALEAIILNRLQRIPANRRQEWLRGLLVQGFRQECQALRGRWMKHNSPLRWLYAPTERHDDKFFRQPDGHTEYAVASCWQHRQTVCSFGQGDRVGQARDRSPAK